MKRFFSPFRSGRSRRGFSLVETVLSLGVMSFGFLALAPLLTLGLNGARMARENRVTAQIAATLIEEAKQGTLAAGTVYLDSASNPCAVAQAAYVVQESMAEFDPGSAGNSGPLSRLTLRIAPRDTAGAARTYADVFPTPPTP
jgi:uncharacterized protein (TIGR02598 family)